MRNTLLQKQTTGCCSSSEINHLKDKFEYRISNVGLFEAVMLQNELNPSLHELWGLLYHRANIYNSTLTIDKAELAKTARNVSHRTIERNLSALITQGWLRKLADNQYFVSVPKRLYQHILKACPIRRTAHSTPQNQHKDYVYDPRGDLLFSTRENPDKKLVIIVEEKTKKRLSESDLATIKAVLTGHPTNMAASTIPVAAPEPVEVNKLTNKSNNTPQHCEALTKLEIKLQAYRDNRPTGMMAQLNWRRDAAIVEEQIAAIKAQEMCHNPATSVSKSSDIDVAIPLINKPCINNLRATPPEQPSPTTRHTATHPPKVSATPTGYREKIQYWQNDPLPIPEYLVKRAEKAIFVTYKRQCSAPKDIIRQILWAVSRLFVGARCANAIKNMEGNLVAALSFIKSGTWRTPKGYDGVVAEYPVQNTQDAQPLKPTEKPVVKASRSQSAQYIKNLFNLLAITPQPAEGGI